MNNSVVFTYHTHVWLKHFIVKVLELVLLLSIIGMHLYSSTYGDDFFWGFLIIGTEIACIVLIATLLVRGLLQLYPRRRIHIPINMVGCALIIISGMRIIYIHQVQYDNFQDNFVKYWNSTEFLNSNDSRKFDSAINTFKALLPAKIDNNDVEHQIEQTLRLGVIRGSLNLLEGIFLTVDSSLAFYHQY